MAIAPVLPAGRIRLVPYDVTRHCERNLAWLADPVLMRFSEQRHRLHTSDSQIAWAKSMNDGPHYLWAVEDQADGLGHVGNVAAHVSPWNGLADLTILIGEPAARGRGLGRAAFACALGWLLGPGGMRKVAAGTLAENLPMIAIMRAAGMTPDGVRSRHYLLDGRETDVIFMAAYSDTHHASREATP